MVAGKTKTTPPPKKKVGGGAGEGVTGNVRLVFISRFVIWEFKNEVDDRVVRITPMLVDDVVVKRSVRVVNCLFKFCATQNSIPNHHRVQREDGKGGRWGGGTMYSQQRGNRQYIYTEGKK